MCATRCLAIVVLAACNNLLGIPSATGTPSDAAVDATVATVDAAPLVCPASSGGNVVGCWFDDYVSPTLATSSAAHDLSSLTIQAYVPDASAAGFQKIDAHVVGPGVFTIDGIPAATSYYLRIFDHVTTGATPRFIVTDRRDLDLGYVTIGRLAPTPVTKQTNVTLQLTGMTAWQSPDYLLVDSFAVDTENFVGYPNAPANPPKAGDTSINTTIDWQASYGFLTPTMLIDGTLHDDLRLTHNTSITVNDQSNHPYVGQRVADAFTSTNVPMVDGQPVTVTGAFTSIPTSSNQTYQINISDLRSAISDGGRYVWEDLNCGLLTNPGASYGDPIGPTFGSFDGNPAQNFTPPGEAVINLGPIAYGDPYPSSWPTVIPCGLTQFRLFKAPGATKPQFARSHNIRVWDNVSNPYVFRSHGHAPSNILVGGKPFLDGGAAPFDGTAPVTITWTAVPGTDYYSVNVGEVTRDVNRTAGTQIASLQTTLTTAKLPGELFQKGHLYLFDVGEVRQNATFATGHFNRASTPFSGGSVTSGMFRLSSDCGNNLTDVATGEECDTAGDSTTCDSDCTLVVCGDGYVNAAANEQCDDIFDSPRCNAGTCKLNVCGDGYLNIQAAEQCDDGNTVNGDGCSATCQLEHCGNGALDAFEDCDDTNVVNGDGCNAFCRIEDGWGCTGAPSVCTHL